MRPLEGEGRVPVVIEEGCGAKGLASVAGVAPPCRPRPLELARMGIVMAIPATLVGLGEAQGGGGRLENQMGALRRPARQRGVARAAGGRPVSVLQREPEGLMEGHVDPRGTKSIRPMARPAPVRRAQLAVLEAPRVRIVVTPGAGRRRQQGDARRPDRDPGGRRRKAGALQGVARAARHLAMASLEGQAKGGMLRLAEETRLPPGDPVTRLASTAVVTLTELTGYAEAAVTLQTLRRRPFRCYEPHLHIIEGGACTLYSGDAGYEDGDVARPGPRHRLWMLDSGWRYECT